MCARAVSMLRVRRCSRLNDQLQIASSSDFMPRWAGGLVHYLEILYQNVGIIAAA